MLRLTLPPKTTEVLGDEAATELAQWFAETLTASRDQAVSRDEYREVFSRLDIIEHDLTGVKERLGAIDARLDSMEGRFDARFDAMEERFDARFDRLQSEMNARLDAVNARFDAMEQRFDARFDAMEQRSDARFDAVHVRIDTIHEVVRSQTRWLIATVIAMGGLISVLITVFQFMK